MDIRLVFPIVCCAVALSCSHPITFDGPVSGERSIAFTAIRPDSLSLDSCGTSFIGSAAIFGDRLAFVDKQFCWVFLFDKDGRFISRNVGQGDKPTQLPAKKIAFYTQLRSGGYAFLGPTWDVHIFDSTFKRMQDYRIDWHSRGNKEEELRH